MSSFFLHLSVLIFSFLLYSSSALIYCSDIIIIGKSMHTFRLFRLLSTDLLMFITFIIFHQITMNLVLIFTYLFMLVNMYNIKYIYVGVTLLKIQTYKILIEFLSPFHKYFNIPPLTIILYLVHFFFHKQKRGFSRIIILNTSYVAEV